MDGWMQGGCAESSPDSIELANQRVVEIDWQPGWRSVVGFTF